MTTKTTTETKPKSPRTNAKEQFDTKKKDLKDKFDKFGSQQKQWHQFENLHKEVYEFSHWALENQLFYKNGEHELFPPPKQNFSPLIECVTNCKAAKVEPKLQSKLKVHVLFDHDTEKKKVDQFKTNILDCFSKNLENLEVNIRTCKKEGHPLGELELEDSNGDECKVTPYAVEYDPKSSNKSTLVYFWDWTKQNKDDLYRDLNELIKMSNGKHEIQILSICRGTEKAAWQAFAQSKAKDKIESYWLPTNEILKDFDAPGLPFAALADKSGLLVWSGHPQDRDLKGDLQELSKGHMLFETEDWHDNPDRPVKDPSEIDMHRERDEEVVDKKDMAKEMKTHHEKVKFFHEQMGQELDIGEKVEDDDDEETKDGKKTSAKKEEKVMPCEHLATQAKDLKRAFFVLRAEIVAQLQDEKKFTSSLVLHVVCQGKKDSCDAFKKEALKVAGAIKKKWHDKKKENNSPAKGDKDKKDLMEASEEFRFGWLYRELMIETTS